MVIIVGEQTNKKSLPWYMGVIIVGEQKTKLALVHAVITVGEQRTKQPEAEVFLT